MVSAMRLLGFDYVFDTNYSADLTTIEEANEFLRRVKAGGPFPMVSIRITMMAYIPCSAATKYMFIYLFIVFYYDGLFSLLRVALVGLIWWRSNTRNMSITYPLANHPWACWAHW